MSHKEKLRFIFQRIGVCFACHDQEGAIKEAVQVEADIQCEESYWKRFEGKRSYYHDKHPHGHSHEKMKEIVEEVEELGIEGNERQARYAHYLQKMCDEKFKNSGPKMTIDKCQSTCDVLENVPRNKQSPSFQNRIFFCCVSYVFIY